MTKRSITYKHSPLLTIIKKVSDSIKAQKLEKDYPSIVASCRTHKISTYTLHLIIERELKQEPRGQLLYSSSCFDIHSDYADIINGQDEISTNDGELSSSQKRMRWKIVKLLQIMFALLLIGSLIGILVADHTARQKAPDPIEVITLNSDTIKIKFTNSRNMTFDYMGETKDVPDGQGIGEYDNGTYNGTYSNGLRHGKGTFDTKDKNNHFEGTFHQDQYSEGTLVLSNGDRFVGTFDNGNPHEGNWIHKDGSIFVKVKSGKKIFFDKDTIHIKTNKKPQIERKR